MRDPLGWAVTLPRMFGIPVRVHWLFVLVTGGLFLRQTAFDPQSVVWWGDALLLTVGATFAVVLLHELGHCLAGRLVGGEPQEVLLWPLGGLVTVDVPHTPKATALTAAGGPLLNLLLALLFGGILAYVGYVPSPLANPFTAELKHTKSGQVHTSDYALRLYKPNTAEPVAVPAALQKAFAEKDHFAVADILSKSRDAGEPYERGRLTGGNAWVYRLYWLNCLLLAVNLLPALPLDGGQLLLCLGWARAGHRSGVATAAYSGVVVALVVFMASIAANEALLMGLALVILYASYTRLGAAEADEAGFGDFSQGYTSLERDDPPAPPRRPPVGPVTRWLQARAARRIQRELEAQQADDARMDQLLDKIARAGKPALTDEERRFLERVSARYRNR